MRSAAVVGLSVPRNGHILPRNGRLGDSSPETPHYGRRQLVPAGRFWDHRRSSPAATFVILGKTPIYYRVFCINLLKLAGPQLARACARRRLELFRHVPEQRLPP